MYWFTRVRLLERVVAQSASKAGTQLAGRGACKHDPHPRAAETRAESHVRVRSSDRKEAVGSQQALSR
jgi:hypothetical protein